jgi:hypothetical protein
MAEAEVEDEFQDADSKDGDWLITMFKF